MAPEMTPRTWPQPGRGFVDDAAAAGWRNAAARALARVAARFAPWGSVTASLEKGQAMVLDGPFLARVECLSGAAWVTSPADGRDLGIKAGEAQAFERPGQVAVSAMGGPARVRLRWR